MLPRSPKLLEDIRYNVEFIVDETANETFDGYLANRRLRHAVERSFEIIGEAVRRLSDYDRETAERLTDRAKMIAFRNILIHAYDQLNQDVIWEAVQKSAPILQSEVEALLKLAADEGLGLS